MAAHTYTPAALEALNALIAAAFDGAADPDISDEVFEQLEGQGDLDALDQLEMEGRDDWAAPDEMDTEIELWEDIAADPYDRGGENMDPEAKCEFMLGSHRPSWLYPRRLTKAGKPFARGRDMKPAGCLFVSMRQLGRRDTAYPKADTRFCIDSGGFTELDKHGKYETSPEEYVAKVRRMRDELGTLDWAAIQDWMVEDKQLANTGLTIEEHQRRTTQSYLTLRALAPEIKWLPTIQGQTVAQYMAHLEMYREAGVNLRQMERVGVGSVCRRQSSKEIEEVIEAIADTGLRIHGFGVKSLGLARIADRMCSSDSLAWSLAARNEGRDQNCQHEAEGFRVKMDAIIEGQGAAAGPIAAVAA